MSIVYNIAQPQIRPSPVNINCTPIYSRSCLPQIGAWLQAFLDRLSTVVRLLIVLDGLVHELELTIRSAEVAEAVNM